MEIGFSIAGIKTYVIYHPYITTKDFIMSKKALEEGKYVAIPRCFFCGQEKNEILISRRLSDISHMHHAVSDKEPCDQCKEYMERGVILVSVRDGEQKSDNPYRTGAMWVITVEAANRIFNMDFNTIPHFAFIEDSAAEKVGLKKENKPWQLK